MESKWTGTVDNAFFNGEKFEASRTIQQAEYECGTRASMKNSYYILSVDVGRKGCQTVICVFKVTYRLDGSSTKQLVNIYDLEDVHFETQAIIIKNLFYKFKAQRVVIDGNGLGIGLVDYMVKPQNDASGDLLPDFGIYNDENNYYRQYHTTDTEENAVYIVKANAALNTEAHTAAKVALETGHLKFLIDERTAKTKLLSTRRGQAMTPEQRSDYLKPYVLTSILREEMLNLREENEGINIILKQANKAIRKDKFSALEYGLYYIKMEEDNNKRRHKKINVKDWKFFN